MKNILIVCLLLIYSVGLIAQSSPNAIFRQGDQIQVELSDHDGYYFIHEIQKGHSLYALSRLFNIPLRTLFKYNELQEAGILDIGQKIKIPIQDDFLFKGESLDGLKYGHFIPVYYKTKPKDNLFRISRVYFNQPTEDLIKRNKLSNNNLDLGQDILIGWFPIDSAKPIIREEEFEEDFDNESDLKESEVMLNNDRILENEYPVEMEDIDSSAHSVSAPAGFNRMLLGNLRYSESMKEIRKSEVANWDNSIPDNGTVYVLHRNAIIDSYVEMYNPTLQRSVMAKVIGRIPYGAYTDDVCLVLSPRAAKLLRALDKRFKVEIKALVFDQNAE